MPRMWKKIPFNGGLNTAKDPRDLTNQVSDVSNVQFIKDGTLQSDGSLVAPTGVTTVFGSMTASKSYGLFTFGADWDMPSKGTIASVANTGAGVGDPAVGNARYTTSAAHGLATGDRVHHYGFTTWAYNGEKDIIVIGATTYDTADTYVVNITGTYVEISGRTNTSNEKYIAVADADTHAAIDIMPVTDNAVHRYMISLNDTFPGTAGTKAVFYYVDGALRVCDAAFTSGNDRKWFGYIKQTHFGVDAYDSWFSKDADIVAPTYGVAGEGIRGICDAAASTNTNLQSTDADAFADLTAEFTAAAAASKWYFAVSITDTEARAITTGVDDDQVTTVALTGTWLNDEYKIFPPVGKGFNLRIQSSGVADSGTWTVTPIVFASTFIYQGGQESLPFEMIGSFTPTADQQLVGNIMATKIYDSRITGGRIYWREENSTDAWKFLLDIDLVQGARTTIDGAWVPWINTVAAVTGSGAAPGAAYYEVRPSNLGGGVSVHLYWTDPPTTITYEALNGFKQSEPYLTAKFKCATVLNRRAWIGNVKATNRTGTEIIYGDRIMYTPPNKFDTFPSSFFLDVGINDGDEFTALQGYNDRLLAFKSETLYIINIAQGEDTGWFLEATLPYLGVEIPAATFKTDIGIVWVNKNGCYYYDGNKIHNLIEDSAGNKILDGSAWNSTITADAIIGYEPIEKQVIVVADSDATAGKTYIYDFSTKTWTYNTSFSQSSNYVMTNFATLNNELIIGRYDTGNQTTIKKWSPTPVAGTGWVTFKDEDFGNPHQIKRIYGFSITYKASVAINMNALMSYVLDGGTSFVTTYIPATELPISAIWNVAYIELSTPISCQSICGKAAWTTNLVRVNDIAIECRPIHKEVT